MHSALKSAPFVTPVCRPPVCHGLIGRCSFKVRVFAGKVRHFTRTVRHRAGCLLQASPVMLRLLALWTAATLNGYSAEPLTLLFMGDNGHHRPEARFQELAPVLEARGITLKYTDRMTDLNPQTLNQFDGLILYANIDRIEPEQSAAVLEYVASGKGFIPLHCATYCWRNSRQMVDLMGAQFLRHGGQVFSTVIAHPDHPVMKGFNGFTSWDETYIHHLHNEQDRTVLEYRAEGDQAEGRRQEPWTWVRTHGSGRVFYTAWGHDQRTWTNPGFQNLVERGIRWACGDDPSSVPAFADRQTFRVPQTTSLPQQDTPFEYLDVGPKIPNYTPGQRWGVQGQPKNLMQKPLSPEESLRRFVTPVGMAVRLWADESRFDAKPIAMNWDERGRLWICETLDYPNELGTDRDRIRICEDTDGDGRADRFTVFADGLSIPTAICIVRGGAVVQNGTETIYLKDTDGDDQADLKQTLITGWAMGDTHGGVSNFRYGLDNWIWAMQGYNNSTPEFNGRKSQTFRMGFWRFRLSQTDPPQVTDLEFIRSTNNNTWGLGITEEGLIFGSTANHNPSTFMPIANRYYEKVRGWSPTDIGTIADTHLFAAITDKVRQVDQFGGYTAGAGHAIYTARTFPQQWWNRTAFVCEPTGHLVGTFVLRPDGTAYQSTSPLNLLASDDEWSAPIMAEVGPDGAVWVLDWYNFIVQHNPTPQGFTTGKGNAYESDLRDKRHGRIYRVVPVGQDREIVHSWTSLAGVGTAELVSALKHPSMNWRLQAQRLLVERNAVDAVPQLLEMLNDPTTDAVGLNTTIIHAVHVLQGLRISDSALNSKIVQSMEPLLRHDSAGVRRNAAAVMAMSEEGQHLLLRSDSVVTDSSPQVRLQGLLCLAEMSPNERAGRLAAVIAQQGSADRWEQEALTSAAATHAVYFLKALAEKGQKIGDSGLTTSEVVSEHLGRGRLSITELQDVIAASVSADPQLAEVVLRGLMRGWPKDHRPQATPALEETLTKLLKTIPSTSKGRLLQLAAVTGSTALEVYAAEILASLQQVMDDRKLPPAERIAAAREAVDFQPDRRDVLEHVLNHVNSQTPPELAVGLLEAAGLSTSTELGPLVIERVSGLTPQMKAAALRVLLSRPATTLELLNAIDSRKIEIGDLTLDQKQALRTHPDPDVRKQAELLMAKGGGLPDPDREKVLQSLLPLCEQSGDAVVGKAMFVKHCSRCHMHGTEGKTIGPNLTGMAVHPKHELLTHIIDPSRSVEGNFRIYTVVRNNGLVINGMMTSESRTSITLIDTEAKEHGVPREDIEELIASRKSLMPEGFEKQMTADELSGLLQFLTDKGRFLPISLDRYATAVSTKGLFHDGDNGPDRMVFSDWAPKVSDGVPFVLTDPRGKSSPNLILLHGPQGSLPPQMPRSVTLPCNSAAAKIHLLSGVGGWSFPASPEGSVSMIVRLHYDDGGTEDHPLINGVHFADYIRRVDVPGSQFAFQLGGQQIRRVTITPESEKLISTIELLKGRDNTAPIIMAVTVERP